MRPPQLRTNRSMARCVITVVTSAVFTWGAISIDDPTVGALTSMPLSTLLAKSRAAVAGRISVTVVIEGTLNGAMTSGIATVHAGSGEQVLRIGSLEVSQIFLNNIGYLRGNQAFMKANFGPDGSSYANRWLAFRTGDRLYSNFTSPAAGLTYRSITAGIFPLAPLSKVVPKRPSSTSVVVVRGTTPPNAGRATGQFEVSIEGATPYLPTGNHVVGTAGSQHQQITDVYSKWGATSAPKAPSHFVWFAKTSLGK